MTNIRIIRSKAFTLGNKLARTMGRSAAFERAWEIVTRGGLEASVRGVSFGSRQEALRRLAGYDPADVRVFLMPEPENRFDKNALAVMVMVNGGRGVYRLGYVPRNMALAAAAVGCRLPKLRLLDGDVRGTRITLTI